MRCESTRKVYIYSDNIALYGQMDIIVYCWCLLQDHNGNEKTIILIDGLTKSLMKFELT